MMRRRQCTSTSLNVDGTRYMVPKATKHVPYWVVKLRLRKGARWGTLGGLTWDAAVALFGALAGGHPERHLRLTCEGGPAQRWRAR